MPKVNVFLSYCRADTATVMPLFAEIKGLLKTVSFNKQTWKIHCYWDAQNIPGVEWDHNIKYQLKEADVIVFFISANFLASGYIQAQEIPIALERMEQSGVHLLPVLLEHCEYQNCPIGHLQFIPAKHSRLVPLSDWRNKKEFRELLKGALKISIKNSIAQHPHHLRFNTDVLTPLERKIHAELFLPPEISKMMKRAGKQKVIKKTPDSVVGKATKGAKRLWKKITGW